MNESNLRLAVFTRLSGYSPLVDMVEDIYSDVPQSDDSGSSLPFPYVVYTVASVTPWDTDDTVGGQYIVQVRVVTRTDSSLARAAIYDQVYNCLNRYDLSVSGSNTVDCLFDGKTEFDNDPDGLTKSGVISFRVTLD